MLSQTTFRIGYVSLVLQIVLAVPAASASGATMLYEFVTGQSEFVLTGGIAGFNETYTVEGALVLDVDFDTNVASFVDVNATLMNASGIRHGASLDSLLNMTGAAGTVVGATALTFTSVDDQGLAVSLDVSLVPTSLALAGANVLECCDFFSYQIDAVAVPEPATFMLCIGAVATLSLCRRHRHAELEYLNGEPNRIRMIPNLRWFLIFTVAVIAAGCGSYVTSIPSPPVPARRSSNKDMDGLRFSFDKWEQGLALMFVDNINGSATSDGSLSGNAYTERVSVRRADGSGYDWLLQTQDGQSGDLTINGLRYDLRKGTLFAIHFDGVKVTVHQLDSDLSTLECDIVACTAFVKANPHLTQLFTAEAERE